MHRSRQFVSTDINTWFNKYTASSHVILPYSRPSDWLALPTAASIAGTQTIVGLYAVYNTSTNFVAFTCTGAYSVNWGDGSSVQNYSSGATASHQYVYSTVTSYNTTTYGSTEVSSRGYSQAIITITPQVSNNLVTAKFDVRHPSGTVEYNTQWLDMIAIGTFFTSLTFYTSGAVYNAMLENFNFVGTNSITSGFASMFRNCYALRNLSQLNTSSGISFTSMFESCFLLQTIPLINTSSGTSFASMFLSCFSLQTIPLINTSSGTSFASMFQTCYSLQTIPLINTSSGTSFTSMFQSCGSLQTIPLINTSSGISFTSMFESCFSLQTIPLINTSSGTSFTSMFQSCNSLQTIPLINTSSGTSFTSMFQSCNSLQTIPLINTSSGTSFASMFLSCYSLQTIPLINTSSGTSFTSMFQSCGSLQTIPLINTSSGTSFTSMFQTCYSLQTIPALVVSGGTSGNFATIFSGCTGLQSAPLSGGTQTISYANCNLSETDIDAIFTGLGIASSGATITVTGNWGDSLTSGDLLIATSKGWTVVH